MSHSPNIRTLITDNLYIYNFIPGPSCRGVLAGLPHTYRLPDRAPRLEGPGITTVLILSWSLENSPGRLPGRSCSLVNERPIFGHPWRPGGRRFCVVPLNHTRYMVNAGDDV